MHLIAKEKGLHPSLHILLRRNPSSLFLCTFRWSQPCPTLCTIPCPAICSPIKEKNPTDTHPTPFSETGTNMDDEERTAGGTVALVSGNGRQMAAGVRFTPNRLTIEPSQPFPPPCIQPSSFRNHDKYLSLLSLELSLNSASQSRLQLIAGPWKRVT